MARIRINGVHLNIEEAGAGPAIVALHGFTGSMATWESFVAAARRDYSVVTVDLLGHGASDAPLDPERYCMERCVEDLAALLDHLGIPRAHWLGYSLGGRIALSAATALPHRTLTLVAEGASPGIASAEERAARARSDRELADWTEKVGMQRFVEQWEGLPLFASQMRLPAATRARLREQRLRNSPQGLANSLRGTGAGAQPPLHHKLAALTAPALFIAGEEDAKFVAIAREMHQTVPRGSLHLIRRAGHAAHLEQPAEFNQAVLAFLAEHSGVATVSQHDATTGRLRSP